MIVNHARKNDQTITLRSYLINDGIRKLFVRQFKNDLEWKVDEKLTEHSILYSHIGLLISSIGYRKGLVFKPTKTLTISRMSGAEKQAKKQQLLNKKRIIQKNRQTIEIN